VNRRMLLHYVGQFAILRPANTSIAIICPWVITHIHLVAAIGIHLIYLGSTVMYRDKSNLAAVGRPGWSPAAFAARKSLLVTTVGIHDVDLVIAIASRDEGDLAAIRRPGGFELVAVGMCQANHIAAIGVHDINLVE